ncbi:MAG TPA: pyridoxamine 5'-phosphate oxidase family protein [Ilumatobacter sp.]|nr:pyridoxamine 5'-phosphate oxidase family protein [Ilumatobacter sp.]
MGKLSMSRSEREAFLADLHVGVLAVERGDGPPLVTPIWYRYSPGGVVEFAMEEASQKARFLRAAGRATLCAQREEVPYAYVTVDGPVTFGTATEQIGTEIAVRYLGEELGKHFVATVEHADELLVQLHPERWHTTDFAKEAQGG